MCGKCRNQKSDQKVANSNVLVVAGGRRVSRFEQVHDMGYVYLYCIHARYLVLEGAEHRSIRAQAHDNDGK